ncbi:KEOPS complex kinase/ATPase Bud32 [Candidatus Nitrosocosmicus franklandus]|uniref:non-specific serine/threonine protein kinase n=1 Tax=Candidatus Nitrosocosmicus franklandianus TaxID=1798806 RepID=A0A484IBQ5_9ARCH|nr:KEOPS complex kinase/ATPase Bud32 [Candidatus Nitrosocosmicus franklandus]VFJ14215.1 Bifunctional UGMP family protein/serine/threonine protein kinase [Candidatus Nitrosocosmicus franklandus]
MFKDGILLKRGAESELYLINWYGTRAISKVRIRKDYRHPSIDIPLRKQRTIHEANILSQVKLLGINAPFIYYLDISNFEIVMEFVQGKVLRDVFSPEYCIVLGKMIGALHSNNIIHGDITTSNFIVSPNGVISLIDFGLSFISERYEDKAADIRLFKEILNSIHIEVFEESYENFCNGYTQKYTKVAPTIFKIVSNIEKRGRYSRSLL